MIYSYAWLLNIFLFFIEESIKTQLDSMSLHKQQLLVSPYRVVWGMHPNPHNLPHIKNKLQLTIKASDTQNTLERYIQMKATSNHVLYFSWVESIEPT